MNIYRFLASVIVSASLCLVGYQSAFAQPGMGMGPSTTLDSLGCTTEGDVAKIVGGQWECADERGVGDLIEDAGVFRGAVGVGLTANFSAFPGASGATGVAAADNACAAAFDGSHAELDLLKLWKAGRDGKLAENNQGTTGDAYWASAFVPFPIVPRGGSPITGNLVDCTGWTSAVVGTMPRGVNVFGTAVLALDDHRCDATNLVVACFSPSP